LVKEIQAEYRVDAKRKPVYPSADPDLKVRDGLMTEIHMPEQVPAARGFGQSNSDEVVSEFLANPRLRTDRQRGSEFEDPNADPDDEPASRWITGRPNSKTTTVRQFWGFRGLRGQVLETRGCRVNSSAGAEETIADFCLMACRDHLIEQLVNASLSEGEDSSFDGSLIFINCSDANQHPLAFEFQIYAFKGE